MGNIVMPTMLVASVANGANTVASVARKTWPFFLRRIRHILLAGIIFFVVIEFITFLRNNAHQNVATHPQELDIAGIVTLAIPVLIAALGLYGCLAKNAPALRWFMIFIAIHGLFSLVIVIYRNHTASDADSLQDSNSQLVDKFKNGMKNYVWVEETANKTNNSLNLFSQDTLAWDALQSLGCCGLDKPEDWDSLRPINFSTTLFPRSCCPKPNCTILVYPGQLLCSRNDIYKEGCLSRLTAVGPESSALPIFMALFELMLASIAWKALNLPENKLGEGYVDPNGAGEVHPMVDSYSAIDKQQAPQDLYWPNDGGNLAPGQKETPAEEFWSDWVKSRLVPEKNPEEQPILAGDVQPDYGHNQQFNQHDNDAGLGSHDEQEPKDPYHHEQQMPINNQDHQNHHRQNHEQQPYQEHDHGQYQQETPVVIPIIAPSPGATGGIGQQRPNQQVNPAQSMAKHSPINNVEGRPTDGKPVGRQQPSLGPNNSSHGSLPSPAHGHDGLDMSPSERKHSNHLPQAAAHDDHTPSQAAHVGHDPSHQQGSDGLPKIDRLPSIKQHQASPLDLGHGQQQHPEDPFGKHPSEPHDHSTEHDGAHGHPGDHQQLPINKDGSPEGPISKHPGSSQQVEAIPKTSPHEHATPAGRGDIQQHSPVGPTHGAPFDGQDRDRAARNNRPSQLPSGPRHADDPAKLAGPGGPQRDQEAPVHGQPPVGPAQSAPNSRPDENQQQHRGEHQGPAEKELAAKHPNHEDHKENAGKKPHREQPSDCLQPECPRGGTLGKHPDSGPTQSSNEPHGNNRLPPVDLAAKLKPPGHQQASLGVPSKHQQEPSTHAGPRPVGPALASRQPANEGPAGPLDAKHPPHGGEAPLGERQTRAKRSLELNSAPKPAEHPAHAGGPAKKPDNHEAAGKSPLPRSGDRSDHPTGLPGAKPPIGHPRTEETHGDQTSKPQAGPTSHAPPAVSGKPDEPTRSHPTVKPANSAPGHPDGKPNGPEARDRVAPIGDQKHPSVAPVHQANKQPQPRGPGHTEAKASGRPADGPKPKGPSAAADEKVPPPRQEAKPVESGNPNGPTGHQTPKANAPMKPQPSLGPAGVTPIGQPAQNAAHPTVAPGATKPPVGGPIADPTEAKKPVPSASPLQAGKSAGEPDEPIAKHSSSSPAQSQAPKQPDIKSPVALPQAATPPPNSPKKTPTGQPTGKPVDPVSPSPAAPVATSPGKAPAPSGAKHTGQVPPAGPPQQARKATPAGTQPKPEQPIGKHPEAKPSESSPSSARLDPNKKLPCGCTCVCSCTMKN